MTDEMRQARINQNLMKQEGDAWDVGYAILFLCSKEAKWITGLIMPVDGGVSEKPLKFVVLFYGRWNRRFSNFLQTTAGKADRPVLKADSLAEKKTKVARL